MFTTHQGKPEGLGVPGLFKLHLYREGRTLEFLHGENARTVSDALFRATGAGTEGPWSNFSGGGSVAQKSNPAVITALQTEEILEVDLRRFPVVFYCDSLVLHRVAPKDPRRFLEIQVYAEEVFHDRPA